MTISRYLQDQFLRQFQLSESAIRQLHVARSLGKSDLSDFPSELLQLNTKMIIRGLLNYVVLQTKQDWLFPFWAHRQLDPKSESFVARSQNPLLINTSHRNWTLLGTPSGMNEAIVDPRGMMTPLPREWSIDVWLAEGDSLFFPSRASECIQFVDTAAPRIVTTFQWFDLQLQLECFVDSTRRSTDVAFNRATVINKRPTEATGWLIIALRPFNPEGVAIVDSIEFRSRRIAYVNKTVGVVFSREPDAILCSNSAQGDTAALFLTQEDAALTSIDCAQGLANAVAAFRFNLQSSEEQSIDYSVALATEKELHRHPLKQTWRVPFEKRKIAFQKRWESELADAAQFQFADHQLQNLFDASRLALLQLHDGDFISPGPFLYHYFWFRDAIPMVRALDILGFEKRARQIIEAFPKRQSADGFFRGPEGEWDSNGAVLWSVYQHYLFTRSHFWLENLFPALLKGARWIQTMRRKSSRMDGAVGGLMPPSLSAEHLGPVDQYFWDTFWSLAGLRSMNKVALTLNKREVAVEMLREAEEFEYVIRSTLTEIQQRLGYRVIPATPHHNFDESAIGSIAAIYPLNLFSNNLLSPRETVLRMVDRFVDEKGFYHPIFHSGYNPYLTLQLAHALLYLQEDSLAWRVANTIFRQAQQPYSFPEAIHPRTGGGVMGDGHHGWAAAEIVLFLRDCLVREVDDVLVLFRTAHLFIKRGVDIHLQNIPTMFGKVSVELQFESEARASLAISNNFFSDYRPKAICIYLPFVVKKIVPISPHHLLKVETGTHGSTIVCSSDVRRLFLEM